MADDMMNQDEIERLLSQAKPNVPAAGGSKPPASGPNIGAGKVAGAGADQPGSASAGPRPPAGGAAASTPASEAAGQDEIDKLLADSGRKPPPAAKPAPAPTPAPVATASVAEPRSAPSSTGGDSAGIAQADVEFLLNQATQAVESARSGLEAAPPMGVISFRLEEFSGATANTENTTIDLVRDVELDLKIELGRTHMYLDDVLRLRKGSVVPLDKLAGDPVDIYVNGRLIARGEVLVLNDNFCVRVAELIAGAPAGV
jgi:flagellar motor switch protein FliN